MGDVVHALAVAPAAVATCCVVADRGRSRIPELTASVVMLLAMADALWTRALPVVVWAAVLAVAGMLLAALGRLRTEQIPSRRPQTMHTALGSIVMAAGLTLMMGGAVDSPLADLGHGRHGGSSAVLTVLVVSASAAFAVSSFAAARRGRWQQRTEHIAMGAAVIAMGGLALL